MSTEETTKFLEKDQFQVFALLISRNFYFVILMDYYAKFLYFYLLTYIYFNFTKFLISGSSFNSDMIETPCQKSNCQNNKVDPALQIEFQKLKLENQKLWCYSQTALKGFRDPQIQSE